MREGKVEKVSVSMTLDLYEALAAEAERRDLPVGILARHLIAEGLKLSILGNLSWSHFARIVDEVRNPEI